MAGELSCGNKIHQVSSMPSYFEAQKYVFSSGFDKNQYLSMNFINILQNQISWKYVQHFSSSDMSTDGRTAISLGTPW
jgi:hypothetical protein